MAFLKDFLQLQSLGFPYSTDEKKLPDLTCITMKSRNYHHTIESTTVTTLSKPQVSSLIFTSFVDIGKRRVRLHFPVFEDTFEVDPFFISTIFWTIF